MTVDETTVAVLLKVDENPTQFLKQLLLAQRFPFWEFRVCSEWPLY
jgi:hypothetical protein